MTDPIDPAVTDAALRFSTEQVLAVHAKLGDAQIPGFSVEFDPIEAELAGAFAEDALNEADALDSAEDATPPAPAPAPVG